MVKKSHLFPNIHSIKPKDSLHEFLFEGVTSTEIETLSGNS